MSQVSGLLRVMVQHDADELVLRLGSSPSFTKAGLPVKLFLRPLGPDRHQQIVGELLDPGRRLSLAGQGLLSFEHEEEDGRFTVEVKDAQSPRFRITRHRRPEATPPPAPEPVATILPMPPIAAAPVEAAAPAVAAALPQEVPEATGPLPPVLVDLLEHAAERGASDLHLATGEPAVLRIDGRLVPLGDREPDLSELIAALDPEARSRLLTGGSVDRAVRTPTGNRFRLNAYRCDQGFAMAFRVLRRVAPELGSLHLPVAIDSLVDLTHGLVLVCGPTGSGKSTTLAALAHRALERRRGLLVTLEDPIEYTFPPVRGSLVRQREIGRHVKDFASGLRDALREDPDLLLVGEMRDAESIHLALTAAETGHLVLASLHSRSAPSAVERIIDTYPPERQRQIRVQLADALRAVVSQRLLPRADGGGRVPAVEILRVNQAAATLIREGKTASLTSVLQTSAAEGMVPLERCLKDLVRLGRITEATARAMLEDGRTPVT